MALNSMTLCYAWCKFSWDGGGERGLDQCASKEVEQLQILSYCSCSVLQSFEPCPGYSVLELAAVKNHLYFLHWTCCSSAVSDINHWQTGQDISSTPHASYLWILEFSEKQFRNNIEIFINLSSLVIILKKLAWIFSGENFLNIAKILEKQMQVLILYCRS